MLRVALLDRHPALLADLGALLECEPDVAFTTVLTPAALRRRLPDLRPHVVVLADVAALATCRPLTRRPGAPQVIVVTPRVEPGVVLAARASGAAALLDARDGAFGMLATVRAAAEGEATLPRARRADLPRLLDRLADDDVPLLTMLLDGRRPAAIHALLGIPPDDLDVRVQQIVDRLHLLR